MQIEKGNTLFRVLHVFDQKSSRENIFMKQITLYLNSNIDDGNTLNGILNGNTNSHAVFFSVFFAHENENLTTID